MSKERDLELWHAWKKEPTQTNLQRLMTQMQPLIGQQSQRWARIVPVFVLEAEAKKLALKAFETYNPGRGVALSTHLVNHLQKLSRIAYARQSTVGVPEHLRIQYNQIVRAKAELEELTGTIPTIEALSDHMALPPHKIQHLLGVVQKKEFMESGETVGFGLVDDGQDILNLAKAEMTPQQRRIFEMRTGNPPKSAPAIMRELGITQGQLSYELTKIKAILARGQALR